jgi:putative DNA primase/helicase
MMGMTSMHDKSTHPDDLASQIENFEFAFSDALAAEGFGTHHIPADGEWHDFRMPGQRRAKKSGAAKLTFGRDGVVIDRRQGNKPIYVWSGEIVELTPEQREALAQQNAMRAAELKRRQEEARQKAAEVFPKLPDATADYPYLKAKRIANAVPLKLKILDKVAWLTVPMFNAITGEFQTLQLIGPTGQKLFLVDGVTAGACVLPGYYGLQALDHSSDPIVITEGYATAEAVMRATGWQTLAAMSCGNLKAVAEAMRQRYPNRQIILAADNDKSGAGMTSANAAAHAVAGKVAVPDKVGADFSDLLLSEGAEAVARIIQDAVQPSKQEEPEPEPETETEPGVVHARSKKLILDQSDPMQCARELMNARYTIEGSKTLHRHRSIFWQWNGSYSRSMEEEAMRSEIWDFLDKGFRCVKGNNGNMLTVPFKPNSAITSNVMDALNAVSKLDSCIEPPAWLSASNNLPPANEFFACGNGLLHLPTGDLYPPTPDYFNLNASTVLFDPNAPPPDFWFKFLSELWSDDEEAKQLLQDWFGYMLTSDTSQQKILLMVGPPRGGRGTIGRVLRALLGQDSVGGPTMSSLGDQFGLEPLLTKTLAIVSDARIGARTDKSMIVERLLSISGEDALTVARKFISALTVKLPTRFMILTNELLALTDSSGAFANRLVILMMEVSFLGRENPKLTDQLICQLPGILNWAIEGYRRLMQRGYFVQPRSSLKAVEDIEMLASPVKAFVRERCDLAPGLWQSVDDLWGAYQWWLEDQHGSKSRHDPGSKNWFSRNLNAAVPGLKDSKRTIGEVRKQCYEGIGLKDPKNTDADKNKTTSAKPDFNG